MVQVLVHAIDALDDLEVCFLGTPAIGSGTGKQPLLHVLEELILIKQKHKLGPSVCFSNWYETNHSRFISEYFDVSSVGSLTKN